MKTIKNKFFAILAFALLINTSALFGQDWNKVNPDGTQTLVDTTLVRTVIVRIAPGETIGPVTHPAHCAYILTDGKLKVYKEGNEPQTLELNKGIALFMNPQDPHKTENIGDKPFSFLIVELKEHPYDNSK